jgi:hypothetical protein
MKSRILLIGLCLFGTQVWCQKPNYSLKDSSKVLQILNNIKQGTYHSDSLDILTNEALAIAEAIKYEKGIALSKTLKVSSYMDEGDYANAVSFNLDATSRFE